MALLSALTKAKDELVKLGYPEEVAENIVSGRLDMRSPAKAERQQSLYPDIFYTGTTSPDIINTPSSRNEIGTGISPQFLFGSESPALAASYAGKKQGRFPDESPTVYPFAIDTAGFDRLLGDKKSWNALENPRIELGGDPLNVYTAPGIGYQTDDMAQLSYELGSPGLLMQDVIDPGPYTKLMRMGLQGKKKDASQFEFDNFLRGIEQAPPTNVVVPDTNRVRSLFAAFDPEYKGSNILGGAATAAVGAGLLAAPEEAEAGFVTRGGRELLEAYHGSPHVFDRFSLDAIGTGEGAQAYGHGLYFADLKGVAKDYRDELTRPRIQFAGKDIDSPYTSDIITEFQPKINEAYDDFAQGWVDEYEELASELEIDYDPDALSEFVELVKTGQEIPISVNKGVPNIDEYGIDANELFDRYQDIEDEFVSNLANISQISILDDIDYVRENSMNNLGIFEKYIEPELAMSKNEGALYRVKIDTRPDQLLDYDKPLSEQPKAVQDAMRRAMQPSDDRGISQQLAAREALAKLEEGKITGQQAYESLSEVMHPFMGERGDVMASQALKDQGLLGIRYDDRISRNSNPDQVEGTSNYVIFDDAAINIAERGAADPRLLALMAGGSGAGLLGMANESVADTAARLRAENDTSGAYAPRSGLLQNVTMAARDLERRLEGSPASLLFPSGYIQHLEEFNRPYERSTYTGALLGALDFL